MSSDICALFFFTAAKHGQILMIVSLSFYLSSFYFISTSAYQRDMLPSLLGHICISFLNLGRGGGGLLSHVFAGQKMFLHLRKYVGYTFLKGGLKNTRENSI